MKKIWSLLKACLSNDMELFVLNNKSKDGKKRGKALPIIIYCFLALCMFAYANMFMDNLKETNLQYVTLSIFVFLSFILTIIEGIYKTGKLLFNCKDDDLLLSLPIKKSTVLFVRIFKFYLFELLFNSVFMIPAMVAYAVNCEVDVSFYVVSFFMLILLPVIPVVLSCIIGAITSGLASRFKYKNLVQIIITSIVFCLLMYVSFNLTDIIKNLAENATSINDLITKLYYPAGAFVNMVTDFKVVDLLIFIGINVGLMALIIFLLSLVYFKINTRVRAISTRHSSNKKAVIKSNSPMKALIKKELKRFTSSPVFITNAGIGLVFYLILCISVCIKFDLFASIFSSQGVKITEADAALYIPLITYGLICFAAFLTSITSSMISLEGRSFNILKSLPIDTSKILLSKVLTAVLVMIPCIVVGVIIIFIFFDVSIVQLLILLLASFVLPLISELIGIIMNLKYPKMDAQTDAEVVKQSTSSTISVFIGMALLGLSIFGLIYLKEPLGSTLAILSLFGIHCLILLGLLIYMKKKSVKEFNQINV